MVWYGMVWYLQRQNGRSVCVWWSSNPRSNQVLLGVGLWRETSCIMWVSSMTIFGWSNHASTLFKEYELWSLHQNLACRTWEKWRSTTFPAVSTLPQPSQLAWRWTNETTKGNAFPRTYRLWILVLCVFVQKRRARKFVFFVSLHFS
jgi:hypothetical protein